MPNVKDVMSTDVEYCTPDDNIYEVSVKMKKENVGIVPIVDKGEVLGVITDRDLVISGTAMKKPGSTTVTNVMNRNLITATPDMSCQEAADLMAKHQIRRLPVVENKKLVGMISLGDLAVNTSTDELAGSALTDISE